MIITITLNAALDRTQRIEHPLQVGKLNRAVSSHLEPGGKGINVSGVLAELGCRKFTTILLILRDSSVSIRRSLMRRAAIQR